MTDLTGAWWNPEQDGSGLVIIDAEHARVLYWYSYAAGFPMLKDEGQIWLIGSETGADRNQLTLYRPSGTWMGSEYKANEPVGVIELEADGDTLIAKYRFTNLGPCKPVMVSPVWGGCGGEWRLAKLA